MHVAAHFVCNCEIKSLPIAWVDGLNLSEMANNAINPSLVYSVFYSVNSSKLANFDLPIRGTFDADGCFKAQLLRFFGKHSNKVSLHRDIFKIHSWFSCDIEY